MKNGNDEVDEQEVDLPSDDDIEELNTVQNEHEIRNIVQGDDSDSTQGKSSQEESYEN